MKDIDSVPYFPRSEKLVEILCQKTQNPNPEFFRVLVAYYFAKVASMMCTTIATHDRGDLPVNMYAINLAPSGQGKGFSTNIIEEQVIHQFKDRFLEETFPAISEINLSKLAVKRAAKTGDDPDVVKDRLLREFHLAGALAFSFDSATPAAVKQMRHKLCMANAGSLNLEIDEIGSNLLSNTDTLNLYLELFDVGKVKQKLIKNTADNSRNEEIDGRTPTNMMLFGTPAKLLNGSRIEDELNSMLETGYARRCFFGYAKAYDPDRKLTPQEVYDMLTDKSSEVYLADLSDHLGDLADAVNFGNKLQLSKDVSLLFIEYRMACEEEANKLPIHEEVRKAEISHRYFKALKLAGAFAFVDASIDVTEDHAYSAIKQAEESGKAFSKLLTRERNFVKLANYIADVGRPVTHVDLVEDLPFYKGNEGQKREMMTLAIAHGYQNNTIIKKKFVDGIEFLQGETIKETDLDKLVVSYSTDIATGYHNQEVTFDQLKQLTQTEHYHWVNHHLTDGHRTDANIKIGFNMIVLDIDGTVPLSTAELLLKDYKYFAYTTKRHTDKTNRFRIVMPISHTLKLDATDYREFMNNILEWIPFAVDEQVNQRARKWLSHNSVVVSDHDGELLDILQFIPKTSKNEERKSIVKSQQSLNNMERWFINNTGTGNRSNQLIKYALMLVDAGKDIDDVRANVLHLNEKLPDKLSEMEVLSTIMQSATKAIYKRDSI